MVLGFARTEPLHCAKNNAVLTPLLGLTRFTELFCLTFFLPQHRVSKGSDTANFYLYFVAMLDVVGRAVGTHPDNVSRMKSEVSTHSAYVRGDTEDHIICGEF